MSKLFELGDDHEGWLKERPEVIQKMVLARPHNKLYRLSDSGHRVTIYSYQEDGTVTVVVSGKYNLVTFERRVFGIEIEDLQECDLPEKDEELGVILESDEEINSYIDVLGKQIREENAAKD